MENPVKLSRREVLKSALAPSFVATGGLMVNLGHFTLFTQSSKQYCGPTNRQKREV